VDEAMTHEIDHFSGLGHPQITVDLSQPLQITLPHETVMVLRLRGK